MELADQIEAHAAEVAFWLVGMLEDECPIAQRGTLCERVTTALRVQGLLSLLVRADTDAFYHCLIRSGLARLNFMTAVHASGYEGYHNATSRSGAVFDALAARQDVLVRDLERVSPRHWNPAGEYQDDFFFYRFFHTFPVRPNDAAEVGTLLESFEAATDGDETEELAVCKALAAREQADFDDAFAQFLDKRSTEIEEAGTRGEMVDAGVQVQRDVYVEGLAILNVAERVGLETEEEYLYCPSIARLPMHRGFDWRRPFGF